MNLSFLRNAFFGTILAGTVLVGCSSKSWDINEVKHWYDVQPENWDECMDMARKANFNNNPDKAVEIYKYAITMAETDEGKDDVRVAQSAAALASLQHRRGILSDAEKYYKKAIPIFEASVGASNPIVIENKRYLVDVLNKSGKLDEAKELDKTLPIIAKKKKTSKSSKSSKRLVRSKRNQSPRKRK